MFCSTEIVEPGVIRHVEGTRFTLGEPDGSDSQRVRAISAAFAAGGLRAPVEARLRDQIWLKLVGNVAFNPITALTGATLGQLGTLPEMHDLLRALFAECAAVAARLGITFPVSLDRRLEAGLAVGDHKTSMLQDLEAGKRLELDCMTGAIVELAGHLDVDVPHTERRACLRQAARPAAGRATLAGCPVALGSPGEALELPCVHAAHPFPAVRGRWADPRVGKSMGVITQGGHVRPILVDPGPYLFSSAGGPVAGDEDIDVARCALEQSQRSEVVLYRVSGVVQVEHRNQDIRKHVASDENPAFLNQQRRVAGGMGVMLDNPDLRAIPGNPRSFSGQAGNEAKQVPRYLLGDVRRYPLGDASLPTRVRQLISDSGRAAGRAVTRRRAEPGVPEQVIPMRMRRKPGHNGLAQLAKVVRQGGHFVAVHPGVDEQHARPAVYDNGVALDELALVDQHTVRDLP